MKHVSLIMVLTFLLGFITPKVFAETSVDIQNNGDGSTSEVHVENSVDNGSSSTTVCINGKCETSKDGNVERQEGGAKVKVETPLRSSSLEGQAITPTVTPTPGKEASISAKKDEVKEEQQEFSLEQMMNTIRNFFSELFSQNK